MVINGFHITYDRLGFGFLESIYRTGRAIADIDRKQLLNYLRASDPEVGLLLLYGPSSVFKRFVFANTKGAPHKYTTLIRRFPALARARPR